MNRTLSMILGAVAVGALCLFCASRHSRLIVNKLTGSSQAVLSEANYSWANVAFDGRDATLNGVAPTPEDRDTALALVGQIRGVRSVSSLLTVGDQVNELRARRGAGLVSLSGSVPTEATRAAILQRANRVFAGDSLDDRLTVSSGPDDPSWTRAVTDGLGLLPRLQNGEIRLVNRDVSLLGRVDKPATRDSLRKWLSEILPDGYTSSTEITVPEASPPLSAEACQAELAEIVSNGQVGFASAFAKLTPESSPILEEVVKVVRRCGDVTIEVAGHTDSYGDAETNLKLSMDRAKAVVDYLTSRGIPEGRLVARGYGESQPITSNRTWNGRAMNRRIEFKILP